MQFDPYIHFWLLDQERERALAARAAARLARTTRTDDLDNGQGPAFPLLRRVRTAVARAVQHAPSPSP